jgi:hypothetical protein
MSSIHRFNGDPEQGLYAWDEIEPKAYNNENVQGVLKHVLVGPNDGAPLMMTATVQGLPQTLSDPPD